MARRKWLWIGGSALFSLSIGIGFLARPEDELAGILQLHPAAKREGASLWYSFTDSSGAVANSINHRDYDSTYSCGEGANCQDIILPSGRGATITKMEPPENGVRTTLELPDDNRPWYERAWTTIQHRLGID